MWIIRTKSSKKSEKFSRKITTATVNAIKRSFLHDVHKALNAHFGPFAGWTLPLYYSSILEEHETVRRGVGLFDVSHLGHLEVSGKGTLEALQALVTQDLNRARVGRACYTPMLNPQGGILDEMIFYRLEGDRFRLVVNASNGDKVLAWIKEHRTGEILIEDLREQVGTLALQGPLALTLLEEATGERFSDLPRYSFRKGRIFQKEAIIARTGYTGEDGVELFVGVQDLDAVWKAVLEAGRAFGIKPIGLGARDTLRLEAGLPLGGSDLDDATTPLEAGLDWTVSWEKGPFIGRGVLEEQKGRGLKRRLVGFELTGPGVARGHCPILKEGHAIGRVTSGTVVPGTYGAKSVPGTFVGKAIGMGYVTPNFSEPGTTLTIAIHARYVSARVVKLPFYRRRENG